MTTNNWKNVRIVGNTIRLRGGSRGISYNLEEENIPSVYEPDNTWFNIMNYTLVFSVMALIFYIVYLL